MVGNFISALRVISVMFLLGTWLFTACQSTSGVVQGNEHGSAPINEEEVKEYKRAVHKCYKVGGHRVVKIEGKLRCY